MTQTPFLRPPLPAFELSTLAQSAHWHIDIYSTVAATKETAIDLRLDCNVPTNALSVVTPCGAGNLVSRRARLQTRHS